MMSTTNSPLPQKQISQEFISAINGPSENIRKIIAECEKVRPCSKKKGKVAMIEIHTKELFDSELKYLENYHKIIQLWTQEPSIKWYECHEHLRYSDDEYFLRVFAVEPLGDANLKQQVVELKNEVDELKSMILYAPGSPIYGTIGEHYHKLFSSTTQDTQLKSENSSNKRKRED